MANPNIETRKKHPRPKKSLGQNFLVNKKVLGEIIDAAELSSEETVVEIGPGRGFLTKSLINQAGHVIAVEIDDVLSERLKNLLISEKNLRIVKSDARDVDITSLVGAGNKYKLVANLPYYSASPIIRRFLEADHKPNLMVVMIQKEVACEMVAPPGKMRMLSVATQLYGKPKIIRYVHPRSFRPIPKVMSAIVRIDVYPQTAIPIESTAHFFDLVRAGFSTPRKQLRNSLSHGLKLSTETTESMLLKADINPTRRAQTLSLSDWGQLYAAFQNTIILPNTYTC